MAALAKIEIILNDDQTVSVVGNIENKVLAFGLLELSKDIIREYGEKNKGLIRPATSIPNLINQ